MTDIIIAIVLLAIVGGAIAYIIKAKKSGAKCIGCPSGGSCSGSCVGNCSGDEASCSCGCHTDAKVS